MVNAEFYRVVWTINALLTVCSEMLPFSGNNQNIKFFGVPPEHFAIGYVHNGNLTLGNIALQYVIQNNCRKVWWCFLMISCTFWRSRFFFCRIHQNYLVALMCVRIWTKERPRKYQCSQAEMYSVVFIREDAPKSSTIELVILYFPRTDDFYDFHYSSQVLVYFLN